MVTSGRPYRLTPGFDEQGDSGIVGDDGQVYLTGMPEKGDIAVNWNGAQRYRVRYRLPESKTAQPVVETEQECR
ncbi:hypothetical protein EH138_24540 [Salmonella enterica subsp. enterica serovar Eastbourne]|uniref:PapC-like C-terminal domain-containing protein n=1 Tax=Salmonella enterica subsp. enterica serovar Eastbourne TaxID=486993 RepID=A0A702BB58_SALET|nr:hypothetical protein [Salmonella enterica subsp. enterica serovar Eastbourne]ECA1897749.1 hypothetical protein [Salmonella enterica subsp. enterica serovar Eastbourne]HAC6678424.1 hypothetical protein [Salmonella enterica subsp. enterica serovar Eastbourne]HAE5115954.1 hypothetical protein [Salmonella enterica subsp. enterica serovar Eastbourne]HAE8030325.1 hypothetical protein [Salmonella enterica subsp. enterica serovar Eastbourne]